jgi:glutamate--cysteine ligase
VMAIAHSGLEGRARFNADGENETIFLQLVEEVVNSGRTPADDLLARYEGPWRRDIDRVFEECAF